MWLFSMVHSLCSCQCLIFFWCSVPLVMSEASESAMPRTLLRFGRTRPKTVCGRSLLWTLLGRCRYMSVPAAGSVQVSGSQTEPCVNSVNPWTEDGSVPKLELTLPSPLRVSSEALGHSRTYSELSAPTRLALLGGSFPSLVN